MISKKFEGIAASTGIGIGSLYSIKLESDFILRESISEKEVPKELKRFENALKKSIKELKNIKQRIEKNRGKASAIILDTLILLLKDNELIETIKEIIREEKVRSEWAIHLVRLKYERIFEDFDNEYFKDRINDVNDALNRLMDNLKSRGIKDKEIPENKPIIILADDIPPSEMANLITRENLKGVILTKGGLNSHSVILLKAFEIPAVINLKTELSEIYDGTEVIVDGIEGEVIFNPSLAIKKEYLNKKEQYEKYLIELKSVKTLPSKTADNFPFKIMANIELPEEVDLALSFGAEGIGLFRTEFLYLFSDNEPTLEEQEKIYLTVLDKMNGKPVVIRTVDIGGEKKSAFFSIDDEDNPALGLRGVRYFLKNPKILEGQIKAILKSSKKHKVKILFPMVTEVEEIRELKELTLNIAKAEKIERENFDIGIMIEVPSAALIIDKLAKEVDYVSIGTNDLIQYTLAVDRGNPTVNYLYKAINPAILRLIKMVADEGKKSGIEVQICGEMASNPIFAMVLLGLGIRSISMSPIAIPLVKRTLRASCIKNLKRISKDALNLSSADEVKEFVIESFLKSCPKTLFENINLIKR